MGIPKFFRWLSGRYPLVCERVTDDNIPEFDNLYLDMNGIIHNCTHPKDGEVAPPATDEERFLAIFYYIDFLFNKIQPQKVFFLGIDGVAPRAKMNEQRARRFRTAKELEELQAKELRERRARGEMVVVGQEDDYNDKVFDPTCITPGTEFMDKLTEALRYYINKRVSEDANWRKPKIILSAPNVPGEGEHKIMDYIRFSRAQPGYRANTRHCLYGLDADLIMLGLLSHEPHFSLLREEVLFGARARKASAAAADPSMQAFYLLHISVLRDYLDHEFGGLREQLGSSRQYEAIAAGQAAGSNEGGDGAAGTSDDAFDLERIIDDYVLMTMLVGNDFLPTLPKLSINGGALNFMFATYTRIRPTLGGYLHDNGELHLGRFETFMRELARVEVDSFKLEVADHQWYQVYKHKARLRGETPDDSCIVSDADTSKPRGGRNRRRGLGADAGPEKSTGLSEGEMLALAPMLGQTTIPIKGGKIVISKSQRAMVDLIRRFAVRALPKVAADRHKVQMQYLPGPASALDNLVVAKAAELLELHVGRDYAHNGSMTLHVAAGSPRAIARLELEDSGSAGEESSASSVAGFVAASGPASSQYAALGGLEDGSDAESDDELAERAASSARSAVPEFARNVGDAGDAAAVAAYVNARLAEFDDVVVVADGELDSYTRTGDAGDFWQRLELWKANYYRTKLDIAYDVPDVAADGSAQTFRAPPAAVEPMSRKYVQSLQWVLHYYFRGCPSWSWFYPYHYAPCISDICAGLADYRVAQFDGDAPYTPYEQLMCVLPPFSRKLLPAPLRALMVDVHSAIRDMFPTTFEVDMNGKKMPWEAVVLIDFVDIDRIRAAMAPCLAQLTDAEVHRNSRGRNMQYAYAAPGEQPGGADDAPEYAAPASLGFPPVRPLRCAGMLFVMPSLAPRDGHGALELVRGLLKGSVTRARMRPGFPSLFTAPHTGALGFNATEVFGFPSKDESLVVSLQPDALSLLGAASETSRELLAGKHVHGSYRPRRVFVSWPYLRDAVLVGVSDEAGVYTIDAAGTRVVYREHATPAERSVWLKLYNDSVYQAKKMQAVVVGASPKMLLHVLPLRAMQMYPNGSLVRDYGFPGPRRSADAWADVAGWAELGVTTHHPNTVLTDLSGAWVNNPRFAEHDAVPLERSLPVGDRVFFIGRTPLYGSPAKVVAHSRDASGAVVGVDVQLVASPNIGVIKHANFLGVNVLASRHLGDRYKPSFVVARELAIPPLLLSRITSKMSLQDTSKYGDASRVHIGLDLKFEARRLKVIGYTKRGPNGWMFSDRAVSLIASYIAAFPDMFARLAASRDHDGLTTVDCFAPPQNADAGRGASGASAKSHVAKQVERLKRWHKDNVSHATMVQVPIDTELLTKAEIDAIVSAQAQAHAQAGPSKKVLMSNVRREAVLRPADAQYLLKQQSFMIGHRVIYVSDRSGSVPLGSRGYVVGLHTKEKPAASDHSHQGANRHHHLANVQQQQQQHQEGVSADMIQMVEVVFDQEFLDGSTLDGRCPPSRGALLPPYQVLDLTSWGLGQNVAYKPTAAPRVVDAIKPAPNTVAKPAKGSKPNPRVGQTAEVAAKARTILNRPAGAGHDDGTISVNVPEPSRAPWADSIQAQQPRGDAHASKIISQLTSAMTRQGQPASASSSASQQPPVSKETHTQNIINTLLAGPMERMAVSSKPKPVPGSNATPLAGHPLVAGQMPLVIEEEYFSDSMDEDDHANAGAGTATGGKQIFYDYSKDNAAASANARRGGRGRGRGRGGHGRGASSNGSGNGNGNANANANANGNGRGGHRGRGSGRGGRGRSNSQQ
ncbi:exonuclease II Exo2 [Coemansia interrupta]|uniref:Exonuclease II Exo2 n=1 Tax=Coemansia interrupta TaxID=1126814 RepID=A0A9W8HJT9_9FUNG|nr:exonuclease II Exo2 [Coemansia interrupta]